MATASVANTTSQLNGKTLLIADATQTITGLLTFSRGVSTPFAVVAGAAVVTNLDADKLDGQEGAFYLNVSNAASGTLPIARGGTGADTAAANVVFAGPASGGSAAPSFRALVPADIPTVSYASVYHDTTQAVTTTGTVLAFNAEELDTSSYHDISTNNSRLTIGTTGVYRLTASAWIGAAGTASLWIRLRKNGSTVLRGTEQISVGGSLSGVQTSALVALTAGDYVEVEIVKTDGSSWTLGSATVGRENVFSITRIG